MLHDNIRDSLKSARLLYRLILATSLISFVFFVSLDYPVNEHKLMKAATSLATQYYGTGPLDEARANSETDGVPYEGAHQEP